MFTLIAEGAVPAFAARFQEHTIFFDNSFAFTAYRVTFPEVLGPGGNSMQISEVQLFGVVAPVPQDVTQPGDTIVGSSNNTPASEVVANAIDNQPTKYLNFDRLNTGFTVTPGIGATIVVGLTLTSANDAPERDPAYFTLEGSNDGSTFLVFAEGTVPAFTARFQKQMFLFANSGVYKTYRLMFPEVAGPGGNSMQISEVELLGFLGPQDVTQPGDPIVGSSNNTPASEVVANAIDNQPTKYLNFDRLNTGFTVTPSVGSTVVVGLGLQSANDAVERDPASYRLEGANDGSTFTLISEGSVPAFPSRFFWHSIYFDNEEAYKTYRLIFPEVVGPGGNSMQIAEVELLGYVKEIRTDIELIRRHPENTPVLEGAQATFRVGLTGPWSVQWYRNGVRIPGATTAAHTTPVVTAEDDGAVYTVEVTGAGGVQTSDPALLQLFTPSETESYGISFVGGGANGAPTSMLQNDIAGSHLQAYWNNLAGGTGQLVGVTNSNNEVVGSLTFDYAATGTWGVGTGAESPTQRMLNGMQAITGTTGAGSVTFSGLPPGNHAILLYTVQVPKEFFQMDFHLVIDGQTNQTVYIRPLNSEEYNAAPRYIRVTSATSATRSVGNLIRFNNVQPGADGAIRVQFRSPDWVQPPGIEPRRGPGLNSVQLLLNPPELIEPPEILAHPEAANAVVGGGLVLTVQASGDNLAIQWFKNGVRILGATGPEYTIHAATEADAGVYSVAVTNAGGTVESQVAVVGVVASTALSEGMVSHFKFDETEGLVASNSVTAGSNGDLLTGSAVNANFMAGLVGNALEFDGLGTYVMVPDYPKVSTALTVSAWIYANDGYYGPVVNNWLSNKGIGAKGQFRVATAFHEASGGATITGGITAGADEPVISLILPESMGNVWNHIALTADGRSLRLYWDGQLMGSAEYAGAISEPAFPWLAIGARLVDVVGTEPVDPPVVDPTPESVIWGRIDDLGIWGRSLSTVEIEAIYAAGLEGIGIADVPPVLSDEPIEGGEPPTLSIQTDGVNIVIEWANGTLEASATVEGGYEAVEGTSPLSLSAGSLQAAQFYRVRGN